MLYLNHAGTSHPKPPEVHDAVRAVLDASPDQWAAIYEQAYRVVSAEFPQGGRVLITSGCTAALTLALGDLPWADGDLLVTSSLEHHALDRQAQALELFRGVVRHELPVQSGSVVDLHRLERWLDGRGVRAVALTAASNITGDRLPLRVIAEHCRKRDVLFVVDAAQTFGTSAFCEAAEVADVIVAAGHKSALGPQGVGVLYARAGVEFSSPGAACEIGEQACGTFPGFCDAGSVNLAGLAGLAAGLEWTRLAGRDAIARRGEEMANELRRQLSQRSEVRVLDLGSSDSGANAVVSFAFRSHSLEEAEAEFARSGLKVRVGTHCAPRALMALGAPDGCVRVSFGPFNEPGDVERVVELVDEIVESF